METIVAGAAAVELLMVSVYLALRIARLCLRGAFRLMPTVQAVHVARAVAHPARPTAGWNAIRRPVGGRELPRGTEASL